MRIYLDRVDYDQFGNKIATFEVDGKMVSFDIKQAPIDFFDELIPNAIVDCEIIDNKIVNPLVLIKETQVAEENMKKRLSSLFKRKNK